MKFIPVFILASLFSFSAFADILTVECVPSRVQTGGASIKLSELKSGKKTPDGYDTYKGSLEVQIGGSTFQPVFQGAVKVQGVLLIDGALNLQAVDSKVSSIYINQDYDSYIKMVDGKKYVTNCRFY